MSPDLLAGLHPPRLPAGMAGTGWPDLLAAFGLGLLIAAALAALAAPLLAPRRRPEGIAARLARLRPLPPGERLLAQARLMAEAGARLPPELRTSLYAGSPHDPAEVEALIRAAWTGRGRGTAPLPGPAGSPPVGPPPHPAPPQAREGADG